jgi:coenzyme PQQ synthesis protein D (PqqD)
MRSTDDTIGADAVPRRRLDSRVRTMRGKTLVAGARQALELDETATFIWRRLDGSSTVGQIAEAVVAEYDVDRQTALADVVELVCDLVECEVVELVPSGG